MQLELITTQKQYALYGHVESRVFCFTLNVKMDIRYLYARTFMVQFSHIKKDSKKLRIFLYGLKLFLWILKNCENELEVQICLEGA
jgi:hypothetical protein